MATTIVSSRVNNRAQVSLVMPSQAIVADSDEDDGSISPHLNTLRSTNEKAKKSELPHVLVLASTSAMIPHGNGGGSQPRDSIPPGHGDNTARIPDPRATRDEDKTSREQDVGSATDVAAAMPEPEIVGSTSQNDPPSYIPAHLHGLMKPLPQGLAGYRRNGHDSGQATPTGYHSGQATPSGYSSGRSSGQATPTGYNRRIPSSSIPHLLSTSANLAAADPQQQQLIASQLSFMGIDAAFSPTIRSRDQSFAFSVDGDDSAFNPNKAAPTPLQIGQMPAHPQMQHQLALCLKQGLTSPMEGGSCSHSSLSLPSVVSSSRNSPLHPPIFPSPPTRATQTDLNMQLDSKQLSQPPTSAVVSNFSHSSLDQNLEAINAEVARIVPDVGKDMLATKSP